MKVFRTFLAGIMLFAICVPICADTFRVRSVTTVTLDGNNTDTQSVEIGYNDALGIFFTGPTLFLKGFEIEIKVPQDILAYPSSMGYGMYRLVQPAPSSRIIDYRAEQITLQPLPSRLSVVLQIPLRKLHNLKSGPYSTVIPYIHDASSGPLLFRLLPVMKGLPSNIETLTFPVKIRPIMADEGAVHISITHPEGQKKPVSVRIDESLVLKPEDVLLLTPGNHHLSITSDDYRNEVRMFTVEAAKITNLAVTMQDTAPRVFLVAPENAVISMDGVPAENTREGRIITPGEHSFLFKIGDYELAKQITIEKGKDYTISLLIDINVTETP